MTEISSIGYCLLEQKLAIWKSMRNLSIRVFKGAEIAKNTRNIPNKKSQLTSLRLRDKFYDRN